MKKPLLSIVAELYAGIVLIAFASCGHNPEPEPADEPVLIIKGIYPTSGFIGSYVTISGDQFIPTVPPEKGVGPHANTSIISFNGTKAEAEYVYQDSIGNQRINAKVPAGAISGKITVTANGKTVSSSEEFFVTKPIYLPNVDVTTIAGWGRDVAIDNEGSLYVTHKNPNEIVKITPDGNAHTLWSTTKDEAPWGIAVDATGNIFTTINQHVLKISADGKFSTLAGSANAGNVDGEGVNARFLFPFGIAVANDGNLYIADALNCNIRKITPTGTVSTLAGSTRGFKDGAGISAQFQFPTDVALDAEGNVYVTDGSLIRKITSSGQVTTIAGGAWGYMDGTTSNARFNSPNGIAIAGGYIYICDTNNYMLRRIAPDGTVATVAGSIFGYLDGPGSTALFSQTQGIAMDASGAIYVTQGGGLYKIRKIVIK